MAKNLLEMRVRLRENGRMTIPKKLRDGLGWNGGDTLIISILERGRVIIKKEE